MLLMMADIQAEIDTQGLGGRQHGWKDRLGMSRNRSSRVERTDADGSTAQTVDRRRRCVLLLWRVARRVHRDDGQRSQVHWRIWRRDIPSQSRPRSEDGSLLLLLGRDEARRGWSSSLVDGLVGESRFLVLLSFKDDRFAFASGRSLDPALSTGVEGNLLVHPGNGPGLDRLAWEWLLRLTASTQNRSSRRESRCRHSCR